MYMKYSVEFHKKDIHQLTLVLVAKETMVRCLSLFNWTVVSSGRLSLCARKTKIDI